MSLVSERKRSASCSPALRLRLSIVRLPSAEPAMTQAAPSASAGEFNRKELCVEHGFTPRSCKSLSKRSICAGGAPNSSGGCRSSAFPTVFLALYCADRNVAYPPSLDTGALPTMSSRRAWIAPVACLSCSLKRRPRPQNCNRRIELISGKRTLFESKVQQEAGEIDLPNRDKKRLYPALVPASARICTASGEAGRGAYLAASSF